LAQNAVSYFGQKDQNSNQLFGTYPDVLEMLFVMSTGHKITDKK
jgi:hypothetical protein